MALCDVAEFRYCVVQHGGVVQIAQEPPYILQPQLPVSAAAASSVPFGASTKFVAFSTDTAIRFKIAQPVNGVAVPATAADRRLDVGQTYFCGVFAGQSLSVIQTT